MKSDFWAFQVFKFTLLLIIDATVHFSPNADNGQSEHVALRNTYASERDDWMVSAWSLSPFELKEHGIKVIMETVDVSFGAFSFA